MNTPTKSHRTPIRSSPSRTGKIARLPHSIREKINQRLQDGESTKPILAWLNSRPAVKKILKNQFESRPVTPQNLSEWRRGGYRDWLVIQNSLALVRSLKDREGLGCGELSEAFAANLAHWTALQYASSAQALVADETNEERRWERLRVLSVEVCRLRRAEGFARRLELEQQRIDLARTTTKDAMEEKFHKWAKREEKKMNRKRRRGLTDREQREIERAAGIYLNCGPRKPAKPRPRVEAMERAIHGSVDAAVPSSIQPDQTQSNPIAPNRTKGEEKEIATQNASETQPTPEQPVEEQSKPWKNPFPPFGFTNGAGPPPPPLEPRAMPILPDRGLTWG